MFVDNTVDEDKIDDDEYNNGGDKNDVVVVVDYNDGDHNGAMTCLK